MGRVISLSEDSTSVIASAPSNERWGPEVDDEGQKLPGNGGIRRTIELDVVSRVKRDSEAGDHFPA